MSTFARMSMFAMETLPRGRRPGSVFGLTLSSKFGTWQVTFKLVWVHHQHLECGKVGDYTGDSSGGVKQVVLVT